MRILAAVVVALATGCAPPEPPPPPPPPTTSSPAPPSAAELDQRAKAALAPPGAFDAIGGKVAQSFPANDSDPGAEREIVTNVCGSNTPLRVDSGTSVARSRIWAGGVNLFERVHAMSDLPATVLLTSVRRRGDGCALSSPAGEVIPSLPLAKPQGVDDIYGYCEANFDPELAPWSCHAALARGTLIAVVAASAQSQEAALAQLVTVVPIFAESLVKA